MTDVSFYEYSKLSAEQQAALLRRSETDISSFIEKVAPIIEAVRTEGDKALARFGRDFDKADVSEANIKVSDAEFDAAFKLVDAGVVESIRFGIDNIRNFHEEQRPEAMWLKEIRPGAFAGDRFTPIKSVALYVPRGKGSFPSVTMMTSVPAVVAGVPDLAIVTPPAPDGSVDAATLVAARLAGVETVYKVGGAQAIAAIAFGTETVKPALKVVGPGSPWVVAAKRALSGVIDTGLPAGPSEVVRPCRRHRAWRSGSARSPDRSRARTRFLCLSCDTQPQGRRTGARRSAEHWGKMSEQRVAFSKTVLTGKTGGIVLTSSIEESYRLRQRLCARASRTSFGRAVHSPGPHNRGVRNPAGHAYAGQHCEFFAGSQCVLPTSRWARTYGPLSVTDFVKRSSIGYVTAPAYAEFARHAYNLAVYEGFSSHALAVSPLRETYLGRKS